MSKAYDKVARARHRDGETEDSFADRIQEAAIDCGDVFDEQALVSCYVNGLQPTIRYAIAESVLQRKEDIDMSVVLHMAIAAGETHRAQSSSSRGTPKTRASARAMVVEPYYNLPTPQPEIYDSSPVLLMPAGTRQEYSDTTSMTTNEEPFREVIPRASPAQSKGAEEVRAPPPMTDNDVQIALRMMSRNRGGYRCWGWREEGHDLYNCPYLSWLVRLFFAKANYDYQAETLGPGTANSHFRMRGHSPSRNGRGGYQARKSVSIASPAVASMHSPDKRFRPPPNQQRPVVILDDGQASQPLRQEETIVEDNDSVSTSSGN